MLLFTLPTYNIQIHQGLSGRTILMIESSGSLNLASWPGQRSRTLRVSSCEQRISKPDQIDVELFVLCRGDVAWDSERDQLGDRICGQSICLGEGRGESRVVSYEIWWVVVVVVSSVDERLETSGCNCVARVFPFYFGELSITLITRVYCNTYAPVKIWERSF